MSDFHVELVFALVALSTRRHSGGAPLGASPDSILTIVVMDSMMCSCTSWLVLRTLRNDENLDSLVGWVERSETHRELARKLIGIASLHPSSKMSKDSPAPTQAAVPFPP